MKTTQAQTMTIAASPAMATQERQAERPQLPRLEMQRQAALRGHRLESLPLGAPDDHYEQEADQTAEQVVERLESGTGSAAPVQATPTPGPAVQAKGEGGGSAAAVLTQLPSAPGSGRPLETTVRAPLEQAMSTDLSDVRLHTDLPAQQFNQSLNARATTVGRDIHFAEGEYAPLSAAGRDLLVHELTHVLQQRRGGRRLQRSGDRKGKKKAPSGTNSQRPTRPAPILVDGQLVSPRSDQKTEPSSPYGHVSDASAPAAYGQTSLTATVDAQDAAPSGPYGHVPGASAPAAYGQTSLTAAVNAQDAAPSGPYGHVPGASATNEYESTDAPFGDGQGSLGSEDESLDASSDAPSDGGAVPASHPPLRRTKRQRNLFE